MADSDNWYWFQAVSISNRRSFREQIRKYEVNARECDTVWRDSWCQVCVEGQVKGEGKKERDDCDRGSARTRRRAVTRVTARPNTRLPLRRSFSFASHHISQIGRDLG